MTKKDSTLIVVVLDRSGSMSSGQDATVEGFNGFLAEQKKLPGECRMTLVQFDDRYQIDFNNTPISEVKLAYAPRGGTALLDAMGRTIDEVGAELAKRSESTRPAKVIFVTITDGYENASRKFTRDDIFNKIAHQRDAYKWEFLYLGANQDAIAEATRLGIPATHSVSTSTQSYATTSGTYGLVSHAVSGTRSGVTSGITNRMRRNYNTSTGATTATPVAGAEDDEDKTTVKSTP